ncbi:primosome, DnaD subunit [Parageobacillus genomosp. 1]|uniref:Primosome, DnaD subunit n=1 Tax=Parageobacillus genomosp. 1 TaxID=1295642 RepID=A0ABC9VGN2_9BACL|nr:conserved phage C-terminal domain-containing protein [Parageobacillus genomosp. 1]EZP77589.1 primosome, DnaD subunit [Parageobacillus genomosp. 1]
MLTGHPIVDEIGKINFEGTVIPHNWFNVIKFDSGKPDVVAIVLLSEIVYWYRPAIIKDELTGRIKEVRKRFKADLLQRSYDSFAEQFGFTKRQVKDALKRLEDAGLIVREFRNIHVDGKAFANVLFIRLNPEKVLEITFGQGGVTLERQGYDVETSGVLRSNVRGYDVETSDKYRDYNTEITTENTTNISIPYREIVDYLNKKAGTSYRHTSKKTQQLIRARWNEGFRLDDFKTVIDKKVAEWLNDPKMNKYLRPETLFGTKFESYLNQKGGVKNGASNPYSNLF